VIPYISNAVNIERAENRAGDRSSWATASTNLRLVIPKAGCARKLVLLLFCKLIVFQLRSNLLEQLAKENGSGVVGGLEKVGQDFFLFSYQTE
jgi:hypothetical protein